MFSPYSVTAEYGVDLEAAYSLLPSVEGHLGLKVIKTWLCGMKGAMYLSPRRESAGVSAGAKR